MKRSAGLSISSHLESGCRFLPFDGVHRADIVAGAAIGAGLFVDHVDWISVADSIDRADRFTCATTRTIINNVVCTHVAPPCVQQGMSSNLISFSEFHNDEKTLGGLYEDL